MLGLNKLEQDRRLVEVVILSHMEPEAGLRVMNSVKHHKLDITRAAFTGGEPVAKYLAAYNVTLFLSKNEADVKEAIAQGIAAALLYDPPNQVETDLNQLRIAFDGDAVIFSDEAEKIYQEKGLEAFLAHEKANAEKPLPEGPFAPLLRAIAKIQKEHKETPKSGVPPIQTALVTARNSPAHERVIKTLRTWGVKIDEMFFLGGIPKEQILKAFRPHIYFDDQHVHAEPASRVVPAGLVPQTNRKMKKRRPKEHPELPFQKFHPPASQARESDSPKEASTGSSA